MPHERCILAVFSCDTLGIKAWTSLQACFPHHIIIIIIIISIIGIFLASMHVADNDSQLREGPSLFW